jgi:hypothetical protein
LELMAAAPPPALAASLAQQAAVWISKQKSAPELRAAVSAFVTKDVEPAIDTATGQEMPVLLGDVPAIGGLLKFASGAIAGGIESGENMTLNELVAIIVTPTGS